MKKFIGYVVLACFCSLFAAGCDTNKPADEAVGAKDRVEKKVEDAREKQNAENPEQ